MKRRLWLAALPLVLAGCMEPGNTGVEVLVGGTLVTARGAAPIEHSVVVVAEGKILSVGDMRNVPIPQGSKKFNSTGRFVLPADPQGRIEPGAPADLIIAASAQGSPIEKTMRGGAWQN